MALKPVNIVVADEKRISQNQACSFLIGRFFANKNGRFSLLSWLLIFCLSTSAIADGDFLPNKTENAPVYSLKDDSWIVNVPTVITLAPGIFFIPEVGYYYMDNVTGKDQGDQWYVGVKWQIDF
jgi:hypothetical protein